MEESGNQPLTLQMTAIQLQTRLAQSVAFSPRLQHAVQLLQMSSMDYADALQQAAQSNPFLDVEETPAVPAFATESDWAAGMDRMHAVESPRRLSHEDSLDHLQALPLQAGLREHLHAQIGVLRIGPRDRCFADALIEALDDDGYLRISLEELGEALGETGPQARDDMRVALRRVQALDPVGVAARSVSECLRLQLDAMPGTPERELAREIVDHHLELLAAHKLQRLARLLNLPEAQVQRAAACIRSLDARPGWRHAQGSAKVVIPDVIVSKVRGTWRTALHDSALPRVRMHHAYAAMFEKHRASGDAAMKACLDQARWTVRNAAQRVSTILDISTAIVQRQKMFMEYGPLAMKPLGLRAIADEVGVHPSTVSRAAHRKYMATPHGVFELHHFFSRGMAHEGGGATAPTALQTLIGELIARESKDAPWSDAALARELATQGFRIARRTVTKYRQSLNIAPIEHRRVDASRL